MRGLTSEIRYQAQRPTGVPGTGSHRLEYFTIKEWLVAGPFAVADPARDIDRDFLGGEAMVQPSQGAAAGDSTWKHLRAGIDTQSCHYHNEGTSGDLNVDFVYCFANLPDSGTVKARDLHLNNKVAYAHTYVFSPSDAEVRLRVVFAAAAVRVLLNGRPVAVQHDRAVPVRLAPGWNRLLLKAACGEAAVPAGQNAWVIKSEMERGTFRTDLYYRVSALTLEIPPLRERKEDIPLLVDHIVKGEAAFKNKSFSKEALKVLVEYPWPVNVRELQNVVHRTLLISKKDILEPEDLPADLIATRRVSGSRLEDVERDHILRVLKETGGQRGKAAEILGIDSKTLYRRLLSYGMGES